MLSASTLYLQKHTILISFQQMFPSSFCFFLNTSTYEIQLSSYFFFFINSLQSDYLCVFGNPSIGYETMIEYFFWGFFSLMISWFLLSFVFFVSGLGCSFLTKDKDLVFTLIPSPGTYEFYYTYSFLYIFLFVYAYGG